jgi:hypothetical protein
MSKSISFSYFGTKLIIVISVITTLLLMMLITVFGITPNEPTRGQYGATQYPASLTSLASGCGDYYLFEPSEGQYANIPAEKRDQITTVPVHQMSVPVYGYMNNSPLFDEEIRFYGMDELDEPILMDKILRTMYEKDTTVIWYTADIAPDDYSLLQDYVVAHDNVLAVKWEYLNGVLPADRKVAFSTWGISQTCEFWTDSTFERFESFIQERPVAKTGTVPVAVVSEKNTLLPLSTRTE